MTDSISRCELFNKLATIPAPPEANDFKAEMYKVIQQMETIDKWIPRNERMPEVDGKYLCCWQGKSVETGMFLNGHFRLYGEIKDRLVTAWMPLPELYREEE